MTRPLFVVVAALVMSFCLSGSAVAAQDSDASAARASAETWLALIDMEKYAESWDSAATGFRSAITSERWQAAARAVRSPLGQLKMRAVQSTKSTTALPGAPDGEYVVFEFTTSFEHKASAVETVAMVHEKDGSWRVGGYFIK